MGSAGGKSREPPREGRGQACSGCFCAFLFGVVCLPPMYDAAFGNPKSLKCQQGGGPVRRRRSQKVSGQEWGAGTRALSTLGLLGQLLGLLARRHPFSSVKPPVDPSDASLSPSDRNPLTEVAFVASWGWIVSYCGRQDHHSPGRNRNLSRPSIFSLLVHSRGKRGSAVGQGSEFSFSFFPRSAVVYFTSQSCCAFEKYRDRNEFRGQTRPKQQ